MIEADKFIPRLVKLGIIGLVLVGLNGKVTQAQRSEQSDGSIDLLSLGCTISGEGELVTNIREDVSIGKQIFTPAFIVNGVRYVKYGHEPFLLTCRLEPSEQKRTLQLMFGMKDHSTKGDPEITFVAYSDGQATASHILTPGQAKTLLIDVTKTSSIALEATCSFLTYRGSCTNLYFLKASILPS